VSRRTRPRRSTRQTPRNPRQAPSARERARAFLPLRSWKLQLVGAAVGVIVAVLSAQSLASAREGVTTYLIQPGDTLSAIATTTGISLDRLVSWNSIKDPNLIIAGQTLALNGSVSAAVAAAPTAQTGQASQAGPAQYTVKQGDTLWGIAQSMTASVDDLVQVNNLTNADKLSVGQVLRVPITASALQRSASAASAKPKPSPTATASPRPTPPPAPTPSPLQQRVNAEAARVGGSNAHVGVAAINLVSGEKLAWHADDEFPSASVMKLPILVELERQIAAGQLA